MSICGIPNILWSSGTPWGQWPEGGVQVSMLQHGAHSICMRDFLGSLWPAWGHSSRCVWIDKESINSVIISDTPADVHQRMLVAASLSVNATGKPGASVYLCLPLLCVHMPYF